MHRRPSAPRRRSCLTLSASQVIVAVVLCGALFSWSAAVTGYILFKDDVLLQFAARHSAMQDDYEDRIAEMKRASEELRTASLTEKAMLSTKLDALIQFQAELQERQNAVANLVGATPAGHRAETPAAATSFPKPRPIGGEERADTGRDTSHLRDPGPVVTGSIGSIWSTPRRSMAARFESAEAGYHRLESQQENILATLEARSNIEKTSLQMVYDSIDATPEADRTPSGGPFIEPPSGDTSDQRIARITFARAEIAGLRSGLAALPIASPADTQDVTSGFGNRPDPFLGRMAFHSGIDFRAAHGAPVRATASGRVAEAGRNGGYGLMVEVAHPQGFATRYAHLSAIAVQEGALIDVGQIIGFVGSTGRSTGPHLHYETRRHGEPVSPLAFLEAGRLAASVQP